MRREELIKQPGYWTSKIQMSLYECALRFMENKGFNRTRLAEHLGTSKGYVTQLLNGDYDHRLSKLVELAISFGYVPMFNFVPIEEYIMQETQQIAVSYWKERKYNGSNVMYSTSSNINEFAILNDSTNQNKNCA